MSATSVSIVVPVYNSERTLRELVERLQATLHPLGAAFELILVNDGSRDRSWRVIEELSTASSWVHGIDLMRNYGQHNALLAGIDEARHAVIVTMDDDLQHRPEDVPLLLAHVARGHDVVYGYSKAPRHSFFRNLASKLTKIVLKEAMGADTARRVSAFRAFRSECRDGFEGYRGAFVSIDVLLTWAAGSFGVVEVEHDSRRHGQSNYTFWMLLRHALNMLTGFSTRPLQLASLIGFAFTLFGFVVLVYVIARYLVEGGSVPGFPFLASIIALFSGAQLFALGVVGEYLARMHFRMMDKPGFVVRKRIAGGTRATDDSETLRLHHVGFAVQRIEDHLEDAAWNLRSEVMHDPLHGARLCLVSASRDEAPVIELVEPLQEDGSAFKSHGGRHHVCFEVANTKTADDYIETHRLLAITHWKPAVLFGGRMVRFAYTRQRELVEFLAND
jgi:undecaprenyl-phosphate 4-deoxy-4-formamido-L-arabinose transferase